MHFEVPNSVVNPIIANKIVKWYLLIIAVNAKKLKVMNYILKLLWAISWYTLGIKEYSLIWARFTLGLVSLFKVYVSVRFE